MVVTEGSPAKLSFDATTVVPENKLRVGSARNPGTPNPPSAGPTPRISKGFVPVVLAPPTTTPTIKACAPVPALVRIERLLRRPASDRRRESVAGRLVVDPATLVATSEYVPRLKSPTLLTVSVVVPDAGIGTPSFCH